jgi:DNA repair protein RecO (recombination protein O)
MSFYEVQGIVLRRKKINTRDCYLSILTREMGRIEVFAAGANAPKNPLNKGASPFVFANFSISGKGSYRLRHVDMIDGFYYIREDMERFLAASFISRSLFAMLPEGEANRALYELSVNTVAIFHKYRELIPAAIVYFLYGATRAVGIEPVISGCMACGESGYVFDVNEGGLFCEEHSQRGRRLSEDEMALLNKLSTQRLVDFLNERHSGESIESIQQLLGDYWYHHWGLDINALREELNQFRQEENKYDDYT